MVAQMVAPLTAAPVSPSRLSATPAPARAGRSRAVQTLVLAALALVSGVLLVTQLGSVDLFGTLASASPGWLAVAVGASLLPFLGSALSLAAAAPGRLPLRRATAVQVASSYAGVVLPPTVGQLAVNAAFLRRLGHSGTSVTATLALDQAASVLVTVVVLTGALAATSSTLALAGSTVITVALVGLGVPALLLLVPPVRRPVVATATAALRELGPRLRRLVRQPARLAAGIGGSLLVTAGYVVALDGVLRAVGTTLPLAQTAVVVLAGTALGSTAPTPGGTGAVEAALTGGLVAAGVPVATALTAVLLYRMTTLWLRVAPGWAAMVVLRRRGVL